MLSQSTCDIIKSIKNQENPIKTGLESVISAVPATEKYKHLLSNEKSLPLSNEYQVLIRLFKYLDLTINYAHLKKSITMFTNIQQAVEQTHGQNCKIQQIQQILSIYPQSYMLSWALINKEYCLFIDFFQKNIGKDEILLRKTRFEKDLVEFAKKHHQKFLETHGLRWENQDSWHPEFDINSLPNIPQSKINDKPQLEIPKMEKFLAVQFNNSEKSKSTQFGDITETEISEISEIKGLSPSIAAKIMAKDRFLKQRRSELIDNSVVIEHNKGERLFKLVEILKVLFSTHKTPSMFLDILINKLIQMLNCKNKRIIEEDLCEIIQNWPEFVMKIETNSGPVVRVNRQNEVKLVDLKQKLKTKYKFE
jgi:hypothetical protein